MNEHINKALVMTLVGRDVGLSEEEKRQVMSVLNQPDSFEKLMGGTKGAAIAFLISKYMKLSQNAQILLSIAGFGIGSYFKSKASDKSKLVQYNNKIKAYELK